MMIKPNEDMMSYVKDVLHYAVFNSDEQYTQYEIKDMNNGVVLIPIYPITYEINENLYNKIFTVLNMALTPERTMIKPLSMQIITFENTERNTARGLFFPWRIGTTKRIVDQFSTIQDNLKRTKKILIMDKISWDFNLSPHLIVTGVSGSGKSYFLNYLIKCCHELGDIVVIDPKSSDAARWARGQTNVEVLQPDFVKKTESIQQGIGVNYLQSVNKRLKQVEELMYLRQGQLYRNSEKTSTDYRELGFKPVFIIADELVALMTGTSKSLRDEFQNILTRIAVLGRESGVFLILAMQSARAEYIPTIVRDSISVRIQLGRINSENTRFLFPELSEMPMVPIGGKGSGIISIAGDPRYAGIEPVATPTLEVN